MIFEIFEHTMIKQYEKDNRNPELLHNIIKEYPKLYDYIFTTLDSCVGKHRVYVAEVETKDYDRFIKVGYTKNTVKQRLSESRYKGKIYLVNVIHEEFFPALGSKKFEKKLKDNLEQYNIVNENVEAPGKGELFLPKHKKKILEEYDSLKNKYKNIRGVKPPN